MKRALNVVFGLTLLAGLIGCEATAKSDMCEPGWQKTASYEKAMSKPTQPSPITQRDWLATTAEYAAPIVTHFPSWFEDPIVIDGDGNDTYGWTGFDTLAAFYSPCRYVVNLVALPVSMIKEPPGVLVCTNLDQELQVCPLSTQPATETAVECNH
jgi:hypothetical protein